MALARSHRDTLGMAIILVQQGLINDNQGKFEESASKYERALRFFKKIGADNGVATATIRIGVVQLRNGKYDKAIKYFLDALKIAEKSGNRFGVMEANYSISWVYLDKHDYDLALTYLTTAEKINDSLPFSSLTLNIYNHFGVAYRQKQEYEKAIPYLEKGILLSNQPEYQGLNITLINNLASVYALKGLKKKAIALQEEALERSRQINNYLRELQSLYALARTYGTDDPSKAIYYLEQAVLLAREKGAHKQEIRFLKAITEFYTSQGKYKEAFSMKQREQALTDSFFYQSTAIRIDSLKSAYELSKSKAKIKELSLINNRNSLELEKSTIIRNVTFAGAGLLLIILGLLYNRYHFKQESNLLLQHRQEEINQKNHFLELLLMEKESLLKDKEGLISHKDDLLKEKEWLLREIHHRVKNNLQIVMSLLNSQAAYLQESKALSAIQESQQRVHAIALIHQKLYQSEGMARIEMSAYIREVCDYLSDSFNVQERICFQLDIARLELDVATAVPLGLIINEAITNSIKYAFPGPGTGRISIGLRPLEQAGYQLCIADDGIGISSDYDLSQSRSLGMSLMRGLSRQLGGSLHLESAGGVTICVSFQGNSLSESYADESDKNV
ncbi:tetratricopeptide repeat protein [Cesiribacter sp. SM1]|uniref:tetratricopeptide repeat-containing sensor histidine kinase n=1 Tax=Cesiribacter sp. SM1 TaxID=2861196 RepID=UPI001CD7D7CC|nr:tetratricopeptide repeat protein [Cesiribacter sp. SM1]